MCLDVTLSPISGDTNLIYPLEKRIENFTIFERKF